MIIKMMIVACCFLSSAFSFAQTKHALIVAIGHYPDPVKNKWRVINSINDIPLIKNALVMNQQFDEKNIRVLADSQATKKGIVDALDQLTASVNKGDVVVIHFSSHGQQIEDDNNDEIDGLDEAIVPYGAVFSSDPAKFEQLAPGYLRDDLFGDKVTQLRNRLGKDGDLLVIIDACHSGTGTRGVETAKVRGGNIPMVSKNFSTQKFSNTEQGVFKEDAGTKLNEDASSYVVISGSQARENNYECLDDNDNPVGSLSYSFSNAISSLKEKITYRGLFALIENVMREKAPEQRPVLEGDGIDRELFGGRFETQQPYFTINRSLSKNDAIVLNGGFVSGITKGSEINFYEPGTVNTEGKKPVGKGKVVSVSSFTATVKPGNADDSLVVINPYAFVSELSYGTAKIKFLARPVNAVDKMLQDSLKNFQLIEFSKICDLFLDTSGSVNNWALKYPNSGNIFQDGFTFTPTSGINELKAALKRFERSRYLKGLQFSEQGLSAKVQLLFIDEKGAVDSAKQKDRTHAGRLELKQSDKVYLRIINSGAKPFYINIVDIQPDGFINPVLPNKNLKDRNGNPAPVKWEDCFVKKSDTLFLRNLPIYIQPPFGDETFKLFLSSSALDLEDILTLKDATVPVNKKGVLNGLEKVFIESNVNDYGQRSVAGKNVNTDKNGTVFSLNFRIVPK